MVETGTTGIDYQKTCASRLPCGVCLITGRDCPYSYRTTVTPNWGITCGSDDAAHNYGKTPIGGIIK